MELILKIDGLEIFVKFIKNISFEKESMLDAIEHSIYNRMSNELPMTFGEIYCKNADFRYLDGSYPDQNDVALALINLIEKNHIKTC